MERLAILVPLLPLAGFVVNGLWERGRGTVDLSHRPGARLAVGTIGSGVVLAAFGVAVTLLFHLLSLPAEHRSLTVPVYTWIHSGTSKVDVSFLLDPLSATMIVMVTGVAFLIHVYSIGYMSHDPGFSRFFSYLNLFTAAMLILVLADNFLVAFVGWEGVGLCSYLLIGFFFDRVPPPNAGMKAFVVNRIGDFGFLLATLLIFVVFGTVRYQEVFQAAPHLLHPEGTVVTAITLFLFLAATGKSAQIPLHIWLPDAMEGPTPVSALIHAATMVTAGVYMVARCHVLYEMAPFSMAVVATVGAATALVAGTMALVQTDIKKVLAYSTVSQLGYMFLACGVGAFAAGIFHLVTHAFFKSLLFLGAGSVMHALSGELDIRKMGGLRSKIPRTYGTFLVASLALAGIFPFAGFFSKDAILGAALVDGRWMLWLVGVAAALLTAVYIGRLFFLTFLGKSRLPANLAAHVHESPPVMTVPLIALAVLSTVGGFIGIPLITGANVLGRWLGPVFGSEAAHAAAEAHGEHHAPVGLELTGMAIALGLAVLGIVIAYRFYIRQPEAPARVARRWSPLNTLFSRLWFFEDFYADVVVEPVKILGNFFARNVDLAVVDGAVNGTGRMFQALGEQLRRIQTGVTQNYALLMGVGAVVIVGLFLFR